MKELYTKAFMMTSNSKKNLCSLGLYTKISVLYRCYVFDSALLVVLLYLEYQGRLILTYVTIWNIRSIITIYDMLYRGYHNINSDMLTI